MKIMCNRCGREVGFKSTTVRTREISTLKGRSTVTSHCVRCSNCDKFNTVIVPDIAAVGSRYGKDVYELVMNMKMMGHSGRSISAELDSKFGVKISHSTCSEWCALEGVR